MGLGMPEILVIAGIVILLFGPKMLPKWGKSLGDTVREVKSFRKEIESLHDDKD